VKTPVIVGRRDDRHDALTKITDGLTLLKAKARWADSWAAENQVARVNPVMLVVAQTIADAQEYGDILRSEEVDGGEWAERVLVVTSKEPDAALAALATVEAPDSPIRVVISVGMLKEGLGREKRLCHRLGPGLGVGHPHRADVGPGPAPALGGLHRD